MLATECANRERAAHAILQMRTSVFLVMALACIASPTCLAATADDKCTVEVIALADGSKVMNSTCDIVTPCGSACAELSKKATTDELNAKADSSYVDAELSKKATTDEVKAKADTTYVDAELSKRATSDEVNVKVDASVMEAKLQEQAATLTAAFEKLLAAQNTKHDLALSALKTELKETKADLYASGSLVDVSTLSASEFTVCGVAANPTVWQENHVGMLGTYASRMNNENWSQDCRLAVKKAMDAGATNIVVRIYDPVDSNHMDFSWTVPASAWYAAYQHPDKVEGQSVQLQTITKPDSVGNFLSHKLWSVGTSAEENHIYSRVLTKPSYIQHYCNGAASTYKYSGIGTQSALNFITGDGSVVHATLCSTGLGVYGPSRCTTGSSYPCYLGGSQCDDPAKGECTSDKAQRAAIAIKLA